MALLPTVARIVNVFFEEFSLRYPLTSSVGWPCFQVPRAAPHVTPDTIVHWTALLSKRRFRPRKSLGYDWHDIDARRIFEPYGSLKDMRSCLGIIPDNEFSDRLMQRFE